MSKLLLILALASAAVAEDTATYYKSLPWFVVESHQSCTLFGTFENKHIVWLNYKPLDKKVSVHLTGGDFESVEAGEKFLVRVDFVKGHAYSKQYPAQIFEGTHRFTSPGVGRDFASSEFLKYMKQSEILAFTLGDGTLVASLSLRGSAKAINALEACAKETVGLNPEDPFAGAELPNLKKAD